MNGHSLNSNEEDDDDDLLDHLVANNHVDDRLSTILEVSCEENTPLKQHSDEVITRQNGVKRKSLFDDKHAVVEEEEEEEEDDKENNLDDIPVSGKGKSFEELLEEKLKEETAAAAASLQNGKSNGKSKFLKKGEGLMRYKPQQAKDDLKKPRSNHEQEPSKTTAPVPANKSRIIAKNDKLKPQTVAKPPSKAPPIQEVRKSIEKIVIKKKEEEDEALKEFEALEQYADEHPSFRSTASFVETILTNEQNKPYNGTGKGAGLNPKLIDLIEELNEEHNHLEETLIEDDEEDYYLKKKKPIVQRKVKRINYDYVESSDDNAYEEEGGLDSIRKRLGSMDFVQSSQESVSNKINNKKYNSDSYTSKSQIEINECEFDDDNTWLDLNKFTTAATQPPSLTVQAPVSDLMAKLFPTLKPQQKQQAKPSENRSNENVNNNVMGSLLKEKLTQLENEIEKFRLNNADLKKTKEKHETDLKMLEKSVLEFENHKLEEIKKFREYKDDELKKLKNEKRQFEQYQKSIKENPDRRERDELERLRKQVGELSEELKQKENRWLANNKRLKDRIEILEKEKDELKEELMLLEKQRLESLMQQQKPLVKQINNKPTIGYQEQLFIDSNLEQCQTAMSPVTTIPPVASLPTVLTRSISEKSISSFSNSSSSVKYHAQQVSPQLVNGSKTVKFKLDDELQQQFITTLIGNRQVKLKEMRKCEDGRVEKLLDDGTTITEFANGTIKEVSANKRHTLVNFYNGDRKEMNLEAGTETYYYAQTNVTQITYTNNGLQVFKFPNGQIEKHYTDKTKEIIFPDKVVKLIYANGCEESRLTNGTVIKVEKNGDKTIEYPNKQREIHTKDYKRREYPDGSVKTVYSNGMCETRYANGRVRVKDELGNIISDKKA